MELRACINTCLLWVYIATGKQLLEEFLFGILSGQMRQLSACVNAESSLACVDFSSQIITFGDPKIDFFTKIYIKVDIVQKFCTQSACSATGCLKACLLNMVFQNRPTTLAKSTWKGAGTKPKFNNCAGIQRTQLAFRVSQ